MLFVDVDRESRQRLADHSEDAGFTLETTGDLEAAVGRLAEDPPDSLLLAPAEMESPAARSLLDAAADAEPTVPAALYTKADPSRLPDDVVGAAATIVEKRDLADSPRFLEEKVTSLVEGGEPAVTPIEDYEILVESARDGIYVLDATGQFRYVNPSLASLLGYEQSELRGAHASTVMAEGELETGQAAVQRLVERDGDVSDIYDMELRTREGERVVVEVHFTVLEDESGAYDGIVGVMRDVTERRRRERQLRRQRERLEEFASLVAHDLRNPVAVVTGCLEAFRETGDEALVDDAMDAARRMDGLIDDLLDLAKAGTTAVDQEPVDLREATHAATQRVEGDGATLTVEDPGVVQGDRERVVQLLENLLRNAVEHGGDDVTVTVDGLDGGFYVADDGPGIPPAERGTVLEHGVTSADDGTGFGLSIVQAVADAHEWELRIRESDAGGARFEFLPEGAAA